MPKYGGRGYYRRVWGWDPSHRVPLQGTPGMRLANAMGVSMRLTRYSGFVWRELVPTADPELQGLYLAPALIHLRDPGLRETHNFLRLGVVDAAYRGGWVTCTHVAVNHDGNVSSLEFNKAVVLPAAEHYSAIRSYAHAIASTGLACLVAGAVWGADHSVGFNHHMARQVIEAVQKHSIAGVWCGVVILRILDSIRPYPGDSFEEAVIYRDILRDHLNEAQRDHLISVINHLNGDACVWRQLTRGTFPGRECRLLTSFL